MTGSALPSREQRRLMSSALYGLDFDGVDPPVGSEVTRALDELAGVARIACGTDASAVSITSRTRQYVLGSTHDGPRRVSRDDDVCSLLMSDGSDDVLVVPDLRELPELADNPYVDGRSGTMRLYAAAPLTGKHGMALGAICVYSSTPGDLDADRRTLLRFLARAAVNVLDERRRALVHAGARAVTSATLPRGGG